MTAVLLAAIIAAIRWTVRWSVPSLPYRTPGEPEYSFEDGREAGRTVSVVYVLTVQGVGGQGSPGAYSTLELAIEEAHRLLNGSDNYHDIRVDPLELDRPAEREKWASTLLYGSEFPRPRVAAVVIPDSGR